MCDADDYLASHNIHLIVAYKKNKFLSLSRLSLIIISIEANTILTQLNFLFLWLLRCLDNIYVTQWNCNREKVSFIIQIISGIAKAFLI